MFYESVELALQPVAPKQLNAHVTVQLYVFRLRLRNKQSARKTQVLVQLAVRVLLVNKLISDANEIRQIYNLLYSIA